MEEFIQMGDNSISTHGRAWGTRESSGHMGESMTFGIVGKGHSVHLRV